MSDRIAFCITDLDAGGAERALVQIATRLQRLGFKSKVFCLSGPGELVQPLETAGIRVVCLAMRSWNCLGSMHRLQRELRAWRPRLLQTFLFHANVAGRWAAYRAGVPVTICGLRVAERDAPWRMRLDRWSQPLVRMNVAVSQGVADFAVREVGFPAEKVCVIRNGVDFETYAHATACDWTELGLPAAARVIAFVGRLHPQKGPEVLLAAAAPLLQQDSGLHLVYVGEGPLRRMLERSAMELGVRKQVHLVGRRWDIPDILKGSAVLCLPSRWEGLPNVVLEAMAAGCPVVATNVEGNRELIVSEQTGLLVPVDAAGDLQTALSRLLGDPTWARGMASTAQEIVEKRFTWNETARQYAELYDRLAPQGQTVEN